MDWSLVGMAALGSVTVMLGFLLGEFLKGRDEKRLLRIVAALRGTPDPAGAPTGAEPGKHRCHEVRCAAQGQHRCHDLTCAQRT